MNLKSFIPLVLYALIYLIIFVLWYYIKMFLKQNEQNRNQLIRKNRVIRNHNVFINTLEKQKRLELPVSMFVLGNKNCDLELTIFTSLHCEMCGDICEIIDKIIFAYEDQIKINFFFKTQISREKNVFLYLLHGIFLFKGEKEFLKALRFWFKNKSLTPWKIDEYNTEENKDSFKYLNDWFSQNGIISTPSIFINGYIYPYEFEKEDLYYYIEGIIENK